MFVCLLRQLCPNTHETIIAREELTQEKKYDSFSDCVYTVPTHKILTIKCYIFLILKSRTHSI